MSSNKFSYDKSSVKNLISRLANSSLLVNKVYTEDGDEIPKNENGYQRGSRWSEATQKLFLISVLDGDPIPSIMLWNNSKTIMEDGDLVSVYEVIDGQQRLNTLNDFKNGIITFELKKHPELASYVTKGEDFSFATLIKKCNLAFNEYEISTILIGNESKEYAVNIFVKINTTSKTLTPHEIRESNNFDNENNRILQEFQKRNFKIYIKLGLTSKDENAKIEPSMREITFKLYLISLHQKFLETGKGKIDSYYKEKINNKLLETETFEFMKILVEIVDQISTSEKKISRMYFDSFYMLYLENEKNASCLLEYSKKVFKHLNEKNTDGSFAFPEDRQIMTLRSSIQIEPKKKFVKKFNELK